MRVAIPGTTLNRDTHSRAILETNKKAAKEYEERNKIMNAKTQEMNQLKEDLGNLKSEVGDIKSLLQQILAKV